MQVLDWHACVPKRIGRADRRAACTQPVKPGVNLNLVDECPVLRAVLVTLGTHELARDLWIRCCERDGIELMVPDHDLCGSKLHHRTHYADRLDLLRASVD